MPRYLAFLRGINVGGHRVKMTDLRRHFEALKFSNVETFIASGNVLFDSPARDTAALERRIERHLAPALGYEAPAFIRTPGEIAAIAAFQPFAPADMTRPDFSINVVFLATRPSTADAKAFLALCTAKDEFRVQGRELYWLCRDKITHTSVAAPALNKAFAKLPGTMRNLKTVRKLAALVASDRSMRRLPCSDS